jgi:transcriptional regulator with XRE-family HTH domain
LETLRRIRTIRGLNQVELAKASGVSQNTISEIETGRREARPATLRKLARALNVDIADFFEEYAESGKALAPLSYQPSLNDALEEERRTEDLNAALSAYLVERRRSCRQLHAFRQHVDRVANRWEIVGSPPTIEEVRYTLNDLAGIVDVGIFEQRAPLDPRLEALIDTGALDEADRFEIEMLHKGIARLRQVAESMAERAVVDKEFERIVSTFESTFEELEQGMAEAS